MTIADLVYKEVAATNKLSRQEQTQLKDWLRQLERNVQAAKRVTPVSGGGIPAIGRMITYEQQIVAPNNAAFVLAVADPTMPNYRILDKADTSITVTDGGALGNITVGVNLATHCGLQVSSGLKLGTPATATVSTTNAVTTTTHSHAVTSSSNPGAAASLLASSASGYLQLVRLGLGVAPSYPLHVAGSTEQVRVQYDASHYTSLTVDASGDLTLGVSGNNLFYDKAIRSSDYASQTTGWRITEPGEGDFRYLYADEMHVKAFIADLEQALAGGQIICKSVAEVAIDFTCPAAGASRTLTVKDLPGASGMAVFEANDFVRLRQFSRSAGSLDVADCWGNVTAYSDNGDGTQKWTFTRTAGNAGSATGTINAGSLALDYGVSPSGYWEVNAIDGLWGLNSPYAQVVTWVTHPGSTVNKAVRTRLGNLRGITSQDNEYGILIGTGGIANTDQYIRLSATQGGDSHFDLVNLDLSIYDSGVLKTQLLHDEGLLMSSGAWGTNTTVFAAVFANDSTVTSLDAGDVIIGTPFHGTAASKKGLHWDNSASTLKLINSTIALGSTPPTSATVGTGVWIDSTGLYGLASNVQQAYISATTGALMAGAGKVKVDVNGISIDGTATSYTASAAIKWVDGNDTAAKMYMYYYDAFAYGKYSDFNLNVTAADDDYSNSAITLSIDSLAAYLKLRGTTAYLSGTTVELGGGAGIFGGAPEVLINDDETKFYSDVRIAGGLYVGSLATDPNENDLTVEGKVGIGRTPTQLLDVYSSSASVNALFETALSTGYGGINVKGNTAAHSAYFISYSASATGTVLGVNKADACRLTASNQPFVIGTTTANEVYIGANDVISIKVEADGDVIVPWVSSQKLGFFGATPIARTGAYTITNRSDDRAMDCNATSEAELRDVVGTLIYDLQQYGLLQ